MKITNKNVMQIEATNDERFCLTIANEKLGELLNYLEDTCRNFEEGVILRNPATGETITIAAKPAQKGQPKVKFSKAAKE